MIELLRRIFSRQLANAYCEDCDWATIGRGSEFVDVLDKAHEHTRLTDHATWAERGQPRWLAERRAAR